MGMYYISIHAPRTGSDFNHVPVILPLGISIHAPRTGSDDASSDASVFFVDFNPRSPHGERHRGRVHACCAAGISIHAPRTGSDLATAWSWKTTQYFNPRSPHGERRHPRWARTGRN